MKTEIVILGWEIILEMRTINLSQFNANRNLHTLSQGFFPDKLVGVLCRIAYNIRDKSMAVLSEKVCWISGWRRGVIG